LEVAQDLLGKKIRYRDCAGIIVETEAYRDDPASHGIRKSERARLLRETYGSIYVYFVYGMHFCLNFTTEREGVGAVLIRAVEPSRIKRDRRIGISKAKDLEWRFFTPESPFVSHS